MVENSIDLRVWWMEGEETNGRKSEVVLVEKRRGSGGRPWRPLEEETGEQECVDDVRACIKGRYGRVRCNAFTYHGLRVSLVAV